MKTKRRWLEIDGEVNSLPRHLINRGYHRTQATHLAQKYGYKSVDIPLECLSEFFGTPVREAEQPEGIYTGGKKTFRACEYDTTDEKTLKFLTMRLNNNPTDQRTYY